MPGQGQGQLFVFTAATFILFTWQVAYGSGADCVDYSVRLADGEMDSEGRIEVCYNGQWGTVCREEFQVVDARVICRQLGLPDDVVKIYGPGEFGAGNGINVILGNVSCSGYENSIADCETTIDSNVDCPNPPKRHTGLQCLDQSEADCKETSVRLQSEVNFNNTAGWVEVCYNGQWGTVCSDSFDLADGLVVCRQLGFPSVFEVGQVYDYINIGEGSGSIWLNHVQCGGLESSIFDCPSILENNYCDHQQDVVVQCSPYTECTHGSVQLADGETATEGRLEVCYFGIWQTVCSDFFHEINGMVVCRQLGLPDSIVEIYDIDNGGVKNIGFDYVLCNGKEDTLLNCSAEFNTFCYYGEVGMQCFNASEGECDAGAVELRNGKNDAEGRVEVCFNGAWGTVCYVNFTLIDGYVVCKQLGFLGVRAIVYDTRFQEGEDGIWLNDVRCTGEEETLLDCDSSLYDGVGHLCDHTQDVGVVCLTNPECKHGDIRLSNNSGQSMIEGRVEVCYNGQWGAVCNHDFSIIDGKVVCRQLGFPYDVVLVHNGRQFVMGNSIILMDDLACTGSESSIFNCTGLFGHGHNCNPIMDTIGVTCLTNTSAICIEGSVQLVNGSSDNRTGRVEVCYNGQWGTVCGNGFDLHDGDVVCKQLGYSGVTQVFKSARFGKGSGNIWLSNVDCVGRESGLFDCNATLVDHGCGHNRDVGIMCRDECTEDDICLSSGPGPNQGRLQICIDKSWGSLCNSSFAYDDARVVCRQLGFSLDDAVILSNSLFPLEEDYRPIWQTEFMCLGEESDIFDCPNVNITSTTHQPHCNDHVNDIAILCFDVLHFSEPSVTSYTHGPSSIASMQSFTCSVLDLVAGGLVEWRWFFEGSEIFPGDRYEVNVENQTSKGELRVNDLRASDEGSYHCLASHVGSTISINQSFQLELQAELSSPSADVLISQSAFSATLTCELTGYLREETVLWLRNSELIDHSQDKYNITSSRGESTNVVNTNGGFGLNIYSYLTILNVTLDDIGVYQCMSNDQLVNVTLDYQVTGASSLPPASSANTSTAVVIGTVVGVLGIVGGVIVVFLIIAFIVRTRRKRKFSEYDLTMRMQALQELTRNSTILNNNGSHDYVELAGRFKDKNKVSEELMTSLIQPQDLKLLEKIGQGEFGVVYRGILTQHKTEPPLLAVAVKTLKGFYSQAEIDDLMQEAEKMKSFDHLHVLTLKGICVGLLESPCIVMPFMSNGSLLSYLRKEAINLLVSDTAEENILLDTMKQLLSMCLQVAKGMAYMSQRKIIHRDLAARNCMISAEGVIKVADFGLAEEIVTTEYFKQDTTADETIKLPIKWMALESIHYGKFSEKTDVWSYGILCWEVFSVGKSPYPGMTPKEVVDMLDSGERISKPSNPACREEVFSLMMTCWKFSPNERPGFADIVERINEILVPLAEYMDFSFTN